MCNDTTTSSKQNDFKEISLNRFEKNRKIEKEIYKNIREKNLEKIEKFSGIIRANIVGHATNLSRKKCGIVKGEGFAMRLHAERFKVNSRGPLFTVV